MNMDELYNKIASTDEPSEPKIPSIELTFKDELNTSATKIIKDWYAAIEERDIVEEGEVFVVDIISDDIQYVENPVDFKVAFEYTEEQNAEYEAFILGLNEAAQEDGDGEPGEHQEVLDAIQAVITGESDEN